MITDEEVRSLEKQALELRKTVVEMLAEAKSGHLGGPLGMADIFAALYFHVLKHDPTDLIACQTVGQLLVSGNTNVTLQASGAITLGIAGSAGVDLTVGAGSTLQVTGSNAIAVRTVPVITSAGGSRRRRTPPRRRGSPGTATRSRARSRPPRMPPPDLRIRKRPLRAGRRGEGHGDRDEAHRPER